MKKFARHATIDLNTLIQTSQIPIDKRSNAWDGEKECVKAFKKLVHDQGLIIQEKRCGWCTLLIGEDGRRTVHRDHIAPKGLYPEWTFEPENLVLACEYCNGFSVKADLDTVSVNDPKYRKVAFHIVHPYIDDPDLHIYFGLVDGTVGVTIHSHSPKGAWTIEKMKLDSSFMTNLRAQDFILQKLQSKLSTYYQNLITDACAHLGKRNP